MSFVYMNYLVIVIVLNILFFTLIITTDSYFFKWIKKYFFYERSRVSKISSVCLCVSFLFLSISSLDLRGKEEMERREVGDQRTLVLIDTSLSMEAEDVLPNRRENAIWIARQFVREAIGHKISLVVFSDTHKQVTPFTNDIDLLDARLSALKERKKPRGGTNLFKTIMEVIPYFDEEMKENARGNIIILSDFEETENFELDIPSEIAVALVAIGTTKGTFIPVRDGLNRFIGHKKYNNEKVISRVDELKMKDIISRATAGKYWMGERSIDTSEMIEFFKLNYNMRQTSMDVRSRPVKGYNIMALGVLFLALAYFLRSFKSFTVVSFFLFFLISLPAQAQDSSYLILENRFKNGFASLDERLKLAELMLKKNMIDQAVNIFKNDKTNLRQASNYLNVYMNFAIGLLKLGNVREGVLILNDLSIKLADEKEGLRNTYERDISSLLAKYLIEDDQNQASGSKPDSKEESHNDKPDPSVEVGGNGQGDSQGENISQDKPDQSEAVSREENKNDGGQLSEEVQGLLNRQKQLNQFRSLSGILRQIMSDDNDLQRQHIDTVVHQPSMSAKKDW